MTKNDGEALHLVGLKKPDTSDIEIYIEMPVKDGPHYYSIVFISKAAENKRIYADDALSAMINALTFVRSIMDPPIPKIEELVLPNQDALQTLQLSTMQA